MPPLDPADAIDLLKRAAALNLACPHRQGSAIHLPAPGRLLMTGDLHGHALNFSRLVKLASLQKNTNHHLVLHELIHQYDLTGNLDLSINLVLQAAQLALQFPNQVHFLLANHDLSQIHNEGVLKNGKNLVASFNEGVKHLFPNHQKPVLAALEKFLASSALAVFCPSGILCSHSLPSPSKLNLFDPAILRRALTPADLANTGSAHLMVWGRKHTPELADQLAKAWNTNLFIMGHQPADLGFELESSAMLILASDHSHGVALPIDLAKTYAIDDLLGAIIPLASVVLSNP